MSLTLPRLTYGDIARGKGDSLFPSLWPDFFWVPSLGATGDTLIDLAGKYNGAGVSSPPWGTDYVNSTNAGAYYSIAGEDLGPTSLTIHIIGSFGTLYQSIYGNTDGSVFFNTRKDAGDISPTLLVKDIGGATNGFEFVADGPGMALGARSTTVVNADTTYNPIGVYRRDTSIGTYGGTWEVWLNGRLEASNNFYLAGSFGGDFTASDTWYLGYAPQWSDSYDNSFKLVALYKHALTPSQIAHLHRDPYCFLRPIQKRAFWITPGEVAEEAPTDTDVTSTLSIITLADYLSSVQADIDNNVTSDLSTLSLVSYLANVQADVDLHVVSDLSTLNLLDYLSTVQAGTDINVVSNLETLSLVSYLSSIQADVDNNIVSDLATLTLLGYAATVQADIDTNVTSDLATLSLLGYLSTAKMTVNAASDLATITLASYLSTVQVGSDININSNLATLTVLSYLSGIQVNVNVASDLATLTLADYLSTVQADVDTNISSSLSTLTLLSYLSNIKININAVSTLATLELVDYNSTVSVTGLQAIISTLATIDLQALSSIVQSDIDVNIVSSLSTITLASYLSQIQADVDTHVLSSLSALDLTTYASTIARLKRIISTLATLELLSYTSTVQANVDVNVASTLATLTLEDYLTAVTAFDARITPGHRIYNVLAELRMLVIEYESRSIKVKDTGRNLIIPIPRD